MFGLSSKEVLSKAILNASQNHISEYKQEIKENFKRLEKSSEDEKNKIAIQIRSHYFTSVTNSVILVFQAGSPHVYAKIKIFLSAVGTDIIAGQLYNICFHSLNNKDAPPKDCIKLNHLQASIMENALHELDDELALL